MRVGTLKTAIFTSFAHYIIVIWVIYWFPQRGSVKHENCIHSSHTCCSLMSRESVIYKINVYSNCRQKMTEMDSKRATTK